VFLVADWSVTRNDEMALLSEMKLPASERRGDDLKGFLKIFV
jgi:hypothetical protein